MFVLLIQFDVREKFDDVPQQDDVVRLESFDYGLKSYFYQFQERRVGNCPVHVIQDDQQLTHVHFNSYTLSATQNL